jgi:RNA polymerase nonessential primary-like sigma factor
MQNTAGARNKSVPRMYYSCPPAHRRPVAPDGFIQAEDIRRIGDLQGKVRGKCFLDRYEEEYLLRKHGGVAAAMMETGKGIPAPAASEKAVYDRLEALDQTNRTIRQLLCDSNERIIFKLVYRMLRSNPELVPDMVQVGKMALDECIQNRFDVERGVRLATYATWWIRQGVQRHLTENDTIRKPPYMHIMQTKVRRSIARLYAQNGVMPTPEQIGADTGIPAEKVAKALESAIRVADESESRGEGPYRERMLDRIPDAGLLPEEAIETFRQYHIVMRVFSRLPPRSQKILSWRFGLGEGDAMTLAGIGAMLGVTRERVRQLQAESLAELRQQVEEAMAERKSPAIPRADGVANAADAPVYIAGEKMAGRKTKRNPYLTFEERNEAMRKEYARGKPLRELSERFNVGIFTIKKICKGDLEARKKSIRARVAGNFGEDGARLFDMIDGVRTYVDILVSMPCSLSEAILETKPFFDYLVKNEMLVFKKPDGRCVII